MNPGNDDQTAQTPNMYPMNRLVPALAAVLLVGSCSTGNDTIHSASGPPALEEAPDGRLGDLANPRHYRLFMRIDPREEGFEAEVSIDIDLNRAAEGIWLHGRGLEVSRASVTRGDGVRPASYTEVLPTGVAYVDFGRMLEPGPLRLDIAYTGNYDRNLSGMFKVEEQGDAFVMAKSESIQARKFLVGFDEPGFKASWDVALEIPEGYLAIANGAEVDRRKASNGFERVEFARVRPTSTFLLSLAVGPFEVVEFDPVPANEIRDTPIPLRGIARSGKVAELDAILKLTAPMIATFERALQQPYPYPKLDIVAAPSWPSGATELAAAPTYREQVILLGEDPSPGAVIRMQSIHAHELAHMWFGNLVTPPWWDDLWLKEGFATWGTPVALVAIDPDGGHDLTATLGFLSAMKLDSLSSARAIREPVTSNATVRSAYDSITYSKSLAMLTMVDSWFGAGRFRPALGQYVATFADEAADSDDFYALIGQATGEPRMTDVFESFVEQNGLPRVSASLDCENEPVVTLRQSRYAPPGSAIDPNRRWSIPLCIRHQAGTVCEVMEEQEARVSLDVGECPEWFIANAGGTGYFRFDIGKSDWRALLHHWSELTAKERILAFDSLVAQSAADPDLLPAADEMAMLMASDIQWQLAVQPFDYWTDRLRFSDTGARAAKRERLAGFLRSERQRPVSTATSADQRLYQYRLQTFLASKLDDPDVQLELAQSARRFIGGEATALTSDQYFAGVYSLLKSSPAGFDAIVEARRNIDDPRFDEASARALGAAAEGQLDKTMEYLFSDAVGPREAYGGLIAAAQKEELQTATWDWFATNHARVESKIPAQWIGRIPSVGDEFCDAPLQAQWEAWMSAWVTRNPSAQRAFDETSERIELCIARKNLSTAN
jgi:alanyl aminopeptidase